MTARPLQGLLRKPISLRNVLVPPLLLVVFVLVFTVVRTVGMFR